jgi:hypothetical protein
MNVTNAPAMIESPYRIVDLTTTLKVSTTQLNLISLHLPPPEAQAADNDPSKLYATIQKDGKTVATFYTSGLMVNPSDVKVADDLAADGTGRSLADQRIQQMLQATGGQVSYAQDMRARAASKSANTYFLAQLAAQ